MARLEFEVYDLSCRLWLILEEILSIKYLKETGLDSWLE